MERLIQPVICALKEGGVPAVRCFPGGTVPRLTGPAAAVSVQSVEAAEGGLNGFLGLRQTDDGGMEAQYGKMLQAVLLVRVFSPDGSCGKVPQILLQNPGGLPVRRLCAKEPVFDPVADCFVTEISVTLDKCLLPLQTDGEDGEYLDFSLEGEAK